MTAARRTVALLCVVFLGSFNQGASAGAAPPSDRPAHRVADPVAHVEDLTPVAGPGPLPVGDGVGGAPSGAAGWRSPLAGAPRVLRAFAPPDRPWLPGHRGVDLAALPGDPVLAAGPGLVGHAGPLAGRGVVVVHHEGGLRTTYLPVRAEVRHGQEVAGGVPLGTLEDRPGHCPTACLHWGLRRGVRYLDPLLLLGLGVVRLLPFWDADALAPPGDRIPRRAGPEGPAVPPALFPGPTHIDRGATDWVEGGGESRPACPSWREEGACDGYTLIDGSLDTSRFRAPAHRLGVTQSGGARSLRSASPMYQMVCRRRGGSGSVGARAAVVLDCRAQPRTRPCERAPNQEDPHVPGPRRHHAAAA
ncbi:murein hydrolase activator EnvC family protein [Rhizohabitans arisaemae]|uniref:murein hydrolase activator EnvC family protein n=1 Tax=Rhizohabitans arisaemae TaxID=2720610 RepID=UPI0024B21149|nr:M23 family metallopeptidase [Rhizohabitans arisaemae]